MNQTATTHQEADMPTFQSFDGRPLAAGDPVRRVHIDDGAPAWATTGRVVGFTPTRVKVEWDDVSYGPAAWQFPRPHSVRSGNLRLLVEAVAR